MSPMHKKVAAASNLITEWAHALRRLGEPKSKKSPSELGTTGVEDSGGKKSVEDEEVLTILTEVLDWKELYS